MEIIDNIDRAIGCHVCGNDLDDSVSGLFCSQLCQEDWYAARSEPLTNYVEPDDLPQHYSNLIEDEAPETTPQRSGLDNIYAAVLAHSRARTHHLDAALYAASAAVFARRRMPRRPAPDPWFVSTNPTPGWLEGAVRSQLQRVGQALEETMTQWLRNFAPAVSHASVAANGIVTWHLEPWQETALERLYANDMVSAVRREREDQVVVEPDVRARALELLRNRNTGPAPRRRRPPRSLGPRT